MLEVFGLESGLSYTGCGSGESLEDFGKLK
jgi:hypothetical protein